ncbi:helix-turn-helix domain-containing protein [Pleomorphovibrio marinus]|uniref:helix-turn-helix domain-containing protein n=1 Tax=Pleomorphovibrio marinus TaxID=2164132 RepID=UPI000E0B191D|nr:transcriptional regulator [Pleomorphovibrio marinus]
MKYLQLIETEKEYKKALQRIEELFDVPKGSPESQELQVLVLLVEKYEAENFDEIPLPDPIDAIKIRMEDLGLKAKDLIPAIGDKGTVSKVLNRKIPLSLKMIRNLRQILGLPVEVLIQEIQCEVS